jgi:intermediate peptidase
MSIESIVKDFTADEHSAAIVFLRDFEKSGIHLPDKQRSEFVELSDRIINLGRTFIQQNPRSVQHLKIPLSSLANLSQSIMRSVITKGEYAYVATDSLECQLIMKYSNNATLRQQIFTAMQSATNESVDVLQQLLTARAQLATLVGKSSYSELQLQDKMAKNPSE